MTSVLLAAGDVSGDAYAADFVRELRALRADARFLGLGGVEMEKAGVEIAVPQRELSVGGLVELLPSGLRIARAWRRLGAALEAARPELVVLVDSAGFNLPLARRARRAGCSVLYYVAPQVWAWRRGRLGRIARRVDRVAVIFPFEVPFYKEAGIAAEFVGHPLVARLEAAADRLDGRSARAALGVAPDARVVALLPGSRRNELGHQLGPYLETARALHSRDPRIRFLLPLAAPIERASVEQRLREAKLPSLLRLDLVDGRSLEVLSASDVALVKPGTATLEAALLGRPLVVAARGNPLTAAVLRRLVQVDFWAMPNLIVGAPIVPEFLQGAVDPERIASALQALLQGPAREVQLTRLAEVRARLTHREAPRRAAQIAEEMIVARRAA
ncbi:MAG: lipid-A-disaccharide synthase [Myxococcota bacterium]